MASNSNVKELPPGDPKLTASIVSHLKSRGLFDQLRRDCLGDVDTKPAYLNLKQRVEGYITKFLATQTWTPDMNKNHVRDRMRREINESGMLSAGLDHLVDQIVNPKIYQVFTPEVENGVRQYLGLSSTKDAAPHQFAPATDAAADAASKQARRTPFLPPPSKSEFSIDETTQDVPGSSFSPEEYAETLSLEELTDSSCEPQLMIVTESNERTEEAARPALAPKKIGSRRRSSSSSIELGPAEITVEPPSPKPKLEAANWSSITKKGPSAADVTPKPQASLDKGKPDFLKSGTRPVEKKDVGNTAEVAKKEVKPTNKDKKERKPDSGKSKEHSSHSSKPESHSKDPAAKKSSSDASRSKMHKHKSDADSAKDAKHSSKEKDKRSTPREKSSSRDEASKSRSDSTKDERSKGSSHHSSRPKEGDGHSDRRRSDDKHRSHHSSSRHDDKKRHGDKHSREEKPREHRSDGHRSHSDSRKDKDRSSTRDSSGHHKSSKSSDKHSEHSKRDRSQEKERKHSSSRRNSSDSKDGATSKASAPHKTVISISQDSFLMSDDTSSHLKLPETSGAEFPEMHTNSHDGSQQGFQGSSQDGSLHTADDSSREASQATSSSNAHQDETKLAEDVADKVSRETPPEVDSECSRSAVPLVEEKEAEILRFSYVTDEMRGNSKADLQLVSSIPEKAELQQNEVPDLSDGVQLVNGDEVSGSVVAGPSGELKQQSPLQRKAAGQKTEVERRSAEKRRQKRRGSDGHDSEGAWSDVTVSSVHTSDLSSYDDRISVSSGDEAAHQTSTEKKMIPLKDIKKITSSSNEDDDRMSKSEAEPNASDGVVASTVYLEEVVEHVPAEVEESQPICPEANQSKSVCDEVVVKTASPSTTVTSEEGPEPKMGLRRTRKINPKYVSEEFSSIFTKGKRPAGTIDFSELANYGKEKHHEEPLPGRTEHRKAPAREDSFQDFGTPTPSDTEQLSDASIPERSRRPSRRPSGSESRSRSESTSSKRYESSDLYKPRPVIKSGTRRSRPLPATLDEEEEEEEEEMEDYDDPSEPLPKRHRGLKVCIGFKRGQLGAFPHKGKAEPGT